MPDTPKFSKSTPSPASRTGRPGHPCGSCGLAGGKPLWQRLMKSVELSLRRGDPTADALGEFALQLRSPLARRARSHVLGRRGRLRRGRAFPRPKSPPSRIASGRPSSGLSDQTASTPPGASAARAMLRPRIE